MNSRTEDLPRQGSVQFGQDESAKPRTRVESTAQCSDQLDFMLESLSDVIEHSQQYPQSVERQDRCFDRDNCVRSGQERISYQAVA